MPRLQTIEKTPVSSSALPRRSGLRPKTIRGPLHVQCTGHGDPNLLHHIIQEVLDWPQIESTAPFVGYQDTVSIRLRETACTDNASAFISGREFARVLLKAPTIYLALPLVCAHWAIVRGWAEPHYLTSYGLIPAGVVVLYTPRKKDSGRFGTHFLQNLTILPASSFLQATQSPFRGGTFACEAEAASWSCWIIRRTVFHAAAKNIQEDCFKRSPFCLHRLFNRAQFDFLPGKELFRESGIKRVLFQYS